MSETVQGALIREEQEYKGVRVTFEGRIGSARVRLKIDVGFGDVATDAAKRAQPPARINSWFGLYA